jgi:hypothetical protein
VGTVRTVQALQFARPEIGAAAIAGLIVFFGHALMLSLLFTATLIQWEKSILPASFVNTGWILTAAWFGVFQCGFYFWQTKWLGIKTSEVSSGDIGVDWLSTGASLLVAFVLGAVLPLGVRGNSAEHSRSFDTRETLAFAWVGLFLTWPMTLAASSVAAALIAWRCPESSAQPFAVCSSR